VNGFGFGQNRSPLLFGFENFKFEKRDEKARVKNVLDFVPPERSEIRSGNFGEVFTIM